MGKLSSSDPSETLAVAAKTALPDSSTALPDSSNGCGRSLFEDCGLLMEQTKFHQNGVSTLIVFNASEKNGFSLPPGFSLSLSLSPSFFLSLLPFPLPFFFFFFFFFGEKGF
mmetsp:Transcript_8606/g.16465  ORF Transcript_8606/g.16465 Transcript_8606/m.16465 type:complete len:112 (+) Transcript_8606:1494-1829(+)